MTLGTINSLPVFFFVFFFVFSMIHESIKKHFTDIFVSLTMCPLVLLFHCRIQSAPACSERESIQE